MIYESSFWKESLIRSIRTLRRMAQKTSLSEIELYKIEREIFIDFYAIRKLLDAPFKISDTTRSQTVKLTYHTNIAPIDWMNKDKIDKTYDLSVAYSEQRDLYFLCSRIIHSYTFLLSSDDSGRFDGFFFCSDHDKNKKLYYLCLPAMLEIFKQIGSDYPSRSRWQRNADGTFEFSAE